MPSTFSLASTVELGEVGSPIPRGGGDQSSDCQSCDGEGFDEFHGWLGSFPFPYIVNITLSPNGVNPL